MEQNDTGEHPCSVDPHIQKAGSPSGDIPLDGFIETGGKKPKQKWVRKPMEPP